MNFIRLRVVDVANLYNSLASESCYLNALKELFTGDKVKCLRAAASTGRTRSSIFDIVSIVSPNNVIGILEDYKGLVSNCSGLSEAVKRQAEVRSAHKLFLSGNALNEMFEALTKHQKIDMMLVSLPDIYPQVEKMVERR
ncbi:hypothetical protein Ddye_010677 [Dipteronia dyeriana]|uniref:Uncharacterized protein n=1 Tax=Dipteronia dyeriana TaxID=168575 RepID=A0AAE0CND4_9ROSI|nr:hypothetical protein Ddye_010677 [Dipteronia dyeriana]